MAEIKTGIFAKNVQKRISRAQEKVLQKLGKADETKDEQFEQCVQNFKKQESEGFRLQREMKAYIAAVKGMQQASMNLTESLHEVYEPDWHGKDDVMTIGKNCDTMWEDFHEKLVDSTLNTLEMYLTQFPDLKVRVAKRSRKLIDYDSARHHLETLQTTTMRNEKKIAKADEDLKKAQRVFDDLNVGLQDELPMLWDSRVGFYVSTFKKVSSLEAGFHKEISFLCHKLYEVMNRLAEQHSDKMFTIQGAPSDSGPLRLARTPSPPDDDDSPDSSPATSPNHTLRPSSPGPPRPKSPSQLKMGPPKPPPPKATPTRELQQEQIIDLFDGGFPEISVTSPQPKEKPEESLLDMDFDPFKPDANTPIGQTQSPMAQALSWDLWTENAEPAQPATDAGFTANWAADFSSLSTVGAEESANVQPAADGQSWPPAEGWPTAEAAQPQGEATTDEASNKAFNRFSKTDASVPTFSSDFDKATDASVPTFSSDFDKATDASVPTFESDFNKATDASVPTFASDFDKPTDASVPTFSSDFDKATDASVPTFSSDFDKATDASVPTSSSDFDKATDASVPTFSSDFDKASEAPETDIAKEEVEAAPVTVPEAPEDPEAPESPVTTPPTDTQPEEIPASSPPAETATSPVESPVSAESEADEQTELPTEDIQKEQPDKEAPDFPPVQETEESPAETALATEEDKESPIEETPTIDAHPEEDASSVDAKPGDPDSVEPKPADEADNVEPQPGDVPDNESKPADEADSVESQPGDESSEESAANNGNVEEKMRIPSVVIEPASSNEGDDDRDGDITSPIESSGNGVIPACQTTKDASGMPYGFLFKAETLHDFEAANPDELALKKGDIVLVVPTVHAEDQDAGWLTGIKENEWSQLGTSAHKGLFPENFTQRLE
ncbi:amphiphysin isoform X2 [Triplophysa dalaica]|uniref:amphiphysin isoform X2 n=1 Tax=Triplophysa dalaica TaxID=1582913 RepID=UPI0024DFC2C0|nr:amphiphysin isoform X2 [Triplophysa dalaica]